MCIQTRRIACIQTRRRKDRINKSLVAHDDVRQVLLDPEGYQERAELLL